MNDTTQEGRERGEEEEDGNWMSTSDHLSPNQSLQVVYEDDKSAPTKTC